MQNLIITNLDLTPENRSMLSEYSCEFNIEDQTPQIGSTLHLSNVSVRVKSVDYKIRSTASGASELVAEIYVGPLDGETIEEFQKRQSLYKGN